ncbi:TerB family tellurite resistance protein [Cyanobium sp. LEGE 06113]|uniref:TerB family tellurite resistance protein n=1 Tax=Cyanobium sp. LEGE 06113 TaxID=1297573 RepID=UPI00188276BE|nr:TerB family tellurite resistance protein [Cyanobium sp. LEGE 06113]MBE9155163.1 TerB family tellurite resistance protein [Cyanobium sp. LEGE 06113]
MTDSNPLASGGGDYDSATIKAGILQEMADLKNTVQSFGVQAIKDGTWFNKFVNSCLGSYERKVMGKGGAAYLQGKYPGLPTDAIASKLCELAEKNAAAAGGLSGASASAAVLTGGMTLPAAITAVMVEVLFTVRLQLRLAYDLHLLYGIPLDASDPEELTRLFAVVYGIKVAEVGGLGVKAFGPEVARAQLFRLIHGNTPVIQAAARSVLGPRIAKQVTQKAILKTAVPIVGTAISAGWNYTTTHMMGIRVRHGVRVTAALREETGRLQGQIGRNEQAEVAVLEGLMALALADRNFDDKEREVYLTFLKQLALPEQELQRLADKVDADLDAVCTALKSIQEPANRESVARVFCLITAADGELQVDEQEVLARLLEALGQGHLLEGLPALVRRFRREDGAVDQALFAAGDVANRAGEKVGEALGWAGKLFSKDKPAWANTDAPAVDFEATVEEKTNQVILAGMDRLTQRFAAGELRLEDYKAQFAVLVEQLNRSRSTDK